MSNQKQTLLRKLAEILQNNNVQLAVAESCTGGGLSATLTSIPGSSTWFDRGFITYSNQAKHEMLGVPQTTLEHHGAVSEATARAMAEGCIYKSAATLSVAITGIAGPGGGTQEKPVGTVWIACAGARKPTAADAYCFTGNREAIRDAAELKALEMLLSRAQTFCSINKQTTQPISSYFFALIPAHATAQALHQSVHMLIDDTTCQPTPLENLHLTLTYLGQLNSHDLDNILNLCVEKSAPPLAPFELTMTQLKHWNHHQLTYLAPEETPEPLKKLYEYLNQHLLQQGFKPERRAFVPHMTIARHNHQNIKPSCITASPWFVHEFCLTQSIQTTKKTSSTYHIIQRWPLPLTSK